eukprot:TRINITY_DN8108_c0_g1_i1.p1 TRINITY_DN8108_c0_g1~~TRINITY_DN8108_c0_g1_i1.p1  ORF type:complete len:109 (-),score=18.58 TRINITY_DN8108_c0_g1_i1:190-516(-)
MALPQNDLSQPFQTSRPFSCMPFYFLLLAYSTIPKIKPKYLDLDSDTDTAISEALSGCLDPAQKVEKIQLEAGPSSSSTSLMVSERKCHGTDTIHMSKSTVRRDYTDI